MSEVNKPENYDLYDDIQLVVNTQPTKHDKWIYLSGPMTGIPDHNIPAFNAKAEYLRSLGFWVVSPPELCPETDRPWEYYMRHDLRAMMDCNVIYCLEGWQRSRGAGIEHALARLLGFEVVYESEQKFLATEFTHATPYNSEFFQ